MNVVIRADASHVMGSGHVMRSLTLAHALRAAGAGVSFVARAHEGDLAGLLRSEGFEVASLSSAAVTKPSDPEPAHAHWVGASWQADACDTLTAIRALGRVPDWLVVDHYGLDARWEQVLRPEVGRIFVIDDLADRSHQCDLLLDQNLFDDDAERYVGKLPDGCATMLGPRYALLQPLYAQRHAETAPRSGAVRRLLMYFGGADHGEFLQLTVRAFLGLERSDIAVDVVTAGDATAVTALARRHPNIQIHGRLQSLAPLMSSAQLAIGAAGSTTWERICLGLPALVVTLADNQRPLAAALHRRGLIDWLGNREEVSEAVLRAALREKLERDADGGTSRACRALVDGQGARRVCTALLLNAATPLQLRPAGAEDEALLLEWANDITTRRASFGRALISPDEHRGWFTARLHAPQDCRLLMCQTEEGVAIGTVRFDRTKDGWRLSYSIGQPYRGRKLARRMLDMALRALAPGADAAQVRARVSCGNAPSHTVLRSLGFAVSRDAEDGVEYRRAL